jgi:signal transduction histidine kinase
VSTRNATVCVDDDGWSAVLFPSGEQALFALAREVRRARLGPIEALAMCVVVSDLVERGRGLHRQVRSRVDQNGLEVDLAISIEGVADRKALADELTACAVRFASSLDTEVDRLLHPERVRVRLHASSSSAQGELDLRRCITVALEELERRQAEIERLGEEVDETNRGVVALYAELDNYSRELEIRDRRKNEFLAMLAHELRNPLAALDLAAEDLQSDNAPHHAARIMRRQLEHLRRMVDDLLDVSRITRGKVEIARRSMDLTRAVRQAMEPRRALAERTGLTVHQRLPDETLWIEGDPTRIEQVVVNLIDNAMKYTPPPGEVSVELERIDDRAEIRVEDSGRGMSADELRDAFELFVQHNPALDRKTGGLGIGLTLVREIVALHGGTVEADSPGPGLGTTFRVSLPLCHPRSPEAEPKSPARAVIDPMSVLLVEDNDDFRELLAERLRRRGFRVDECRDGLDALARLRSSEVPDAVIADVGLPGLDGYALARAIRAEARISHVKLVALTGYGGTAAMTRTREAGFDAHLVKPVRVDALLETLSG